MEQKPEQSESAFTEQEPVDVTACELKIRRCFSAVVKMLNKETYLDFEDVSTLALGLFQDFVQKREKEWRQFRKQETRRLLEQAQQQGRPIRTRHTEQEARDRKWVKGYAAAKGKSGGAGVKYLRDIAKDAGLGKVRKKKKKKKLEQEEPVFTAPSKPEEIAKRIIRREKKRQTERDEARNKAFKGVL